MQFEERQVTVRFQTSYVDFFYHLIIHAEELSKIIKKKKKDTDEARWIRSEIRRWFTIIFFTNIYFSLGKNTRCYDSWAQIWPEDSKRKWHFLPLELGLVCTELSWWGPNYCRQQVCTSLWFNNYQCAVWLIVWTI